MSPLLTYHRSRDPSRYKEARDIMRIGKEAIRLSLRTQVIQKNSQIIKNKLDSTCFHSTYTKIS